jgi:hypothetical protein
MDVSEKQSWDGVSNDSHVAAVSVPTLDTTSPIVINCSTYPQTNANPSESPIVVEVLTVLMVFSTTDIPFTFESLAAR